MNFTQSFIAPNDTRLFPGLGFFLLPFVIFRVQPEYIALLFMSSTVLLTITVVQHMRPTTHWFIFFVTLFPPIVARQYSKISTEALLISVLFLTYLSIKHNKHFIATLLFIFSCLIRPIAFMFYLSYIWTYRSARKYIPFFSLAPLTLGFMNIFLLHTQLNHQFISNAIIGRIKLPIIWMFFDMIRAWQWGQYRILLSGCIYIFTTLWILIKLFRKNMYLSQQLSLLKRGILMMSAFIFIIGPEPFLEESPRLLSVLYPFIFLFFIERKDYLT